MANDMFAAVEKYLGNRFPVEWNTGLILSVNALSAQVALGGSGAGQTCSFNPDMVVQRGDTVLLSRSKWTKLWVVNQVVTSTRGGNSVASRPTPNNVPGAPHWGAWSMQSPVGGSLNGTAIIQVGTANKNFNGGTPILLYNGYVTPGASDVQLDIGWGEDADYQVIYRATIKSTTPFTPVNIFDVLGGQAFNGNHTFNIKAQLGAGSITTILNCTRFAIGEL